ncbi:MAG: GNAT family N-acetyltransferase [Aureispira sp.]|nr:GNAT family N-acetyltransferase [Aureispira sp.]
MTTNNIHNLTSLWKTAALAFDSYQALPYFDYAYVEGAQWPNRLWFHQDLTKASVLAAKLILEKTPTPLIIPYFDIYNNRSFELLEAEGFQISLEQIAMFLKPKELVQEKANFHLQKVSNKIQANLWAKLFKQAFGYLISPETVLRNLPYLSYYIAYDNGQAIGTGLTNLTHQTVGVHSIGVPPTMRRKGFAEAIMINLINQAIEDQVETITLQASKMGKGLYLKLGFQEQFEIKSYRLNV